MELSCLQTVKIPALVPAHISDILGISLSCDARKESRKVCINLRNKRETKGKGTGKGEVERKN